MSDWPALPSDPSAGVCHSGMSLASLLFDIGLPNKSTWATGGTWPANNLAIYMPFLVNDTVTAYQMGFEVTTQSGNCDVGIYDELGNRLVSAGSTGVGAAGAQVIDITDTVLTPALYFMALCISTTVAAVTRTTGYTGVVQQTIGVRQQAVGAVTLPDPATFANPTNSYIPALTVAFKSTI